MILPDLLKDNLKIVFCGTAAGNKSAERKAYYAVAGNLFYPALLLLSRHFFYCRLKRQILQNLCLYIFYTALPR